MIKINKGNSFSRITGMNSEVLRAIRAELSYTPEQNYHYAKFKPRPRYLIDEKGRFPSGLVSKVEALLTNHKLPYLLEHHARAKPTAKDLKLNLGAIKPYTAQLEASKIAYNRGEGIVSMPTGTGKSLTIALTIDLFQLKTLIIVPNLELKKQFDDQVKQYFGNTASITVLNIDSPKLRTETDYDLLIIDECHHTAARTYHQLSRTAWKGIRHRVCFTATAYRNIKEEMILFQAIAGDVVYHLSYKDAIDADYIVPVEAYYVDLPKTPNDYYSWAEVYKNLIVNNGYRNGLISGMMHELSSGGVSTLCLVKEVEHGDNISAIGCIKFINGQDEDSRDYIRQFNKGGIMSLIGTTGIIGEGVDSRPAEYIIVAGLGKAKSAFMQNIGRGVRKYPGKETCKVILFRDASHKFTLRHFNAQKKILLDELGVIPIKLNITGGINAK